MKQIRPGQIVWHHGRVGEIKKVTIAMLPGNGPRAHVQWTDDEAIDLFTLAQFYPSRKADWIIVGERVQP